MQIVSATNLMSPEGSCSTTFSWTKMPATPGGTRTTLCPIITSVTAALISLVNSLSPSRLFSILAISPQHQIHSCSQNPLSLRKTVCKHLAASLFINRCNICTWRNPMHVRASFLIGKETCHKTCWRLLYFQNSHIRLLSSRCDDPFEVCDVQARRTWKWRLARTISICENTDSKPKHECSISLTKKMQNPGFGSSSSRVHFFSVPVEWRWSQRRLLPDRICGTNYNKIAR